MTPTVNKGHVKTHSYMYSGYDDSKNNYMLPDLFEPYLQYMKSTDKLYNQVICNWYEDENDYIAPHSDCTRNMINNHKIALISLYKNKDPMNARVLDIIPKNHTLDDSKSLFDKISIHMYHGTIITMCGTTQNDFMHGIAKETDNKGNRISLSFRQMNESNN
jgi:alkylated DNA repair dioxygenase AlkB